MTREDAIALTEALYRLRGVATFKVKGAAMSMMKDGVVAAEREVAEVLRRAGFDPGRSALEADAVKLELLRREVDVPAEPLDFAVLLGEAAEADGSQVRGFQITLARFAEFWQRAVYAVPRTNAMTGESIPAAMPDDPVHPVGPFLERHGRPAAEDVAGWLQLYVVWAKEAHAAFLVQVGLRG